MCTIYISHFEPAKKKIYQTQHNAGLKLLSYALADYAGIFISEKELPEHIGTGPHGKPFLKDHPDIHYNISNCEDTVVCAFDSMPLGVDIEKIQSFLESIIRRTLIPEEQDFLNTMSKDDASRQEWFFRFWTLKESRIKHSGLGLSMPLTDFSFSFDLDKNPYEIICSEEGIYFSQQILEHNYVLSLCTSHPQTQLRIMNAAFPPT